MFATQITHSQILGPTGRSGGCCSCCRSLDDSVLEDVEREQQMSRESRQLEAQTKQPNERTGMILASEENERRSEGDYQSHTRDNSEKDAGQSR